MPHPAMCHAPPRKIESTSKTKKPIRLSANPMPCVMLLANSSMMFSSLVSLILPLPDKRAQRFYALAEFCWRHMPVLLRNHIFRGRFARRNQHLIFNGHLVASGAEFVSHLLDVLL